MDVTVTLTSSVTCFRQLHWLLRADPAPLCLKSTFNGVTLVAWNLPWWLIMCDHTCTNQMCPPPFPHPTHHCPHPGYSVVKHFSTHHCLWSTNENRRTTVNHKSPPLDDSWECYSCFSYTTTHVTETINEREQFFGATVTKYVYINVCSFKVSTMKIDPFVPLSCHYSNQFWGLFLKPVSEKCLWSMYVSYYSIV